MEIDEKITTPTMDPINQLINTLMTQSNEKLKNDLMTSSVGSILDDTTPSDSGVQLLDSESSELNESLMSNSGYDFFDVGAPDKIVKTPIDEDLDVEKIYNLEEFNFPLNDGHELTKSDIVNSNVCLEQIKTPEIEEMKIPDELMTSITSNCSTFDTENIVYRRRAKKSKSHSAPKKRVSFHEDILKNTKTDNIHIEHGFITYKGLSKNNSQAGRYSWSSHGDNEDFNNENNQIVYRNACSDVLDYGNEDDGKKYVYYDNSGVFEYGPHDNRKKDFYKCNCSSSNSSLDSGSSQSDDATTDDNKRNYAQAKSNSCDCIELGMSQSNNNLIITENCYYSEPNIEKSVWSKDKKPKTSCLKKSKRHTDILQEHNLSNKVKKFNVHQLPNIIDNSKMIFGSLKNMFSIPLPERGVPEGQEDLQSVCECIPETLDYNTPQQQQQQQQKSRPKLSKSLDGGIKDIKAGPKRYVHNVDEQLRRKNDEDLYAPSNNVSRENSKDFVIVPNDTPIIVPPAVIIEPAVDVEVTPQTNFRNKFIINCESIVYEHTGVSYCYEGKSQEDSFFEKNTPIAEPSSKPFTTAPFKKKLTNMFKSLTESSSSTVVTPVPLKEKPPVVVIENIQKPANIMEISMTSSCSDKESTLSDYTITTTTTSTTDQTPGSSTGRNPSNDLNSSRKNRHLSSPLRKKSITTTRIDRTRMSPDLFNNSCCDKNISLSEEFDDILTITTTDTDKTDSDIVIVDYQETIADKKEIQRLSKNYLKPPSTKTSLINRFLRNVTQKKIMDASIKKNTQIMGKMKSEKKLFGNLYPKAPGKRIDKSFIDDLNAEIAMEIEMSSVAEQDVCKEYYKEQLEFGVGEISIEIFNGNSFHILMSDQEILMKAFKLYTGYSREGFMTPVLVFLTDKTIYVTDLVRNRLCNKFVLPYTDLDVILMGPYGNTVLLSNGSRDMQQVLLAGGPYPANGLVASLEICARKGGFTLPATGQLTLDHLAPLQAFVQDHSLVSKDDPWLYYAVVNVPASTISEEKEPLGPSVKGPLMHRKLPYAGVNQSWHAGYFLLKAGVLYMFNDASQKIPSWAVALTECQGARRAQAAGRPHCFELLLLTGILQLAAPDEYVASDWLQSLIQAASGLFELQERHLTLGCTLVVTQNHLITFREDFRAPLRRITPTVQSPIKECADLNLSLRKLSCDSNSEGSSMISSISSSSKCFDRRSNSNMSTPTNFGGKFGLNCDYDGKSFTNMSSFYGKNSGVEILTCAALEEMIAVKISPKSNNWWCVLEFSCQEVRESSDDLVVFFATSAEQERFMSMMEAIWQSKYETPFPVSVIEENDQLGESCSKIFSDLNKSWEPLLTAALGFPQ